MTKYCFRIAWMLPVLCLAGGLVIDAAAQAAQDDLASPTLRIVWADFKKLYDEGAVVVVDVRGKDAYQAGHIPGARSIPLEDIERHASDLKRLKKPIVVYCA